MNENNSEFRDQVNAQLVDIRTVACSNKEVLSQLASGELKKLASTIAIPQTFLDGLPLHQQALCKAIAVGRSLNSAVVVGRSAGRLLEMWVVGDPRVKVEVALPTGKIPPPTRQSASFVDYRSALLTSDEIVELDGVRSTNAVRSFVDIARWHGFLEGLVAADWLLSHGVKKEDLQRSAIGCGRLKGIATVRDCIAHARSDSQSPYESYARALLIQAGYEDILCQVRVGPYFIDLVVNGTVAVEIDGDEKYLHQTHGMATSEVLLKERKREKEIVNKGYRMLRFSPSDLLFRPQEVLADIKAALPTSEAA